MPCCGRRPAHRRRPLRHRPECGRRPLQLGRRRLLPHHVQPQPAAVGELRRARGAAVPRPRPSLRRARIQGGSKECHLASLAGGAAAGRHRLPRHRAGVYAKQPNLQRSINQRMVTNFPRLLCVQAVEVSLRGPQRPAPAAQALSRPLGSRRPLPLPRATRCRRHPLEACTCNERTQLVTPKQAMTSAAALGHVQVPTERGGGRQSNRGWTSWTGRARLAGNV